MALINLSSSPPALSLIKTVTQILPYKNTTVIVVGHSPDSLKKLEILYEVRDTKSEQCLRTGTISKFAVTFLTPYVSYDVPGSYLVLAASMGCKKIIREGFGLSDTKTLVR